jgi:hypothetical protein
LAALAEPAQFMFCFSIEGPLATKTQAKHQMLLSGWGYIQETHDCVTYFCALQNQTSFRSRRSMLAQVLQIFWGKEHLIKNRLISTLDKVIYFKGTIFQCLQNLSSVHKKGGDQLKKILPFFKHASSSIAPKISMMLSSEFSIHKCIFL